MGNNVQCRSLNEISHQNLAYGQFQIEEQNSAIAVVQKLIDMSNMQPNQLWKELSLRKTIHSHHLVQLQSFDFTEQANLMHLFMRYEYCPYSLKGLQQQHLLSNTYFLQNELIAMISGVQKGLRCLYRANIHHGCVNEQTILRSEKGVFKITDISSTSYILSYELTKRGDRNQALSQKMVQMFNLNILSSQVKRHLEIEDDLFSLGLVALAVALKITVSKFYEYTLIKEERILIQINYIKIDNYLKLARQKIGKQFAKRIEKILTVNKQDLTYQKEDQSYITSERSNNSPGEECKKSNSATNTL